MLHYATFAHKVVVEKNPKVLKEISKTKKSKITLYKKYIQSFVSNALSCPPAKYEPQMLNTGGEPLL